MCRYAPRRKLLPSCRCRSASLVSPSTGFIHCFLFFFAGSLYSRPSSRVFQSAHVCSRAQQCLSSSVTVQAVPDRTALPLSGTICVADKEPADQLSPEILCMTAELFVEANLSRCNALEVVPPSGSCGLYFLFHRRCWAFMGVILGCSL